MIRDYDSNLKYTLGNYKEYNAKDNGKLMLQMNPKWRTSSYSAIDQINEHCTSWLCDATVWSAYCDENVAKYAIGSPSLEMFVKSYNLWKKSEVFECRTTQSKYGYTVVDYGATGSINTPSGDYPIEDGPGNVFCHDDTNSAYLWLSSPAGTGNYTPLATLRYGYRKIMYGSYSDTKCVRPVVSIL